MKDVSEMVNVCESERTIACGQIAEGVLAQITCHQIRCCSLLPLIENCNPQICSLIDMSRLLPCQISCLKFASMTYLMPWEVSVSNPGLNRPYRAAFDKQGRLRACYVDPYVWLSLCRDYRGDFSQA